MEQMMNHLERGYSNNDIVYAESSFRLIRKGFRASSPWYFAQHRCMKFDQENPPHVLLDGRDGYACSYCQKTPTQKFADVCLMVGAT